MKNTASILLFAVAALSLAACQDSFKDGFEGAKCANDSKDEASCKTCCTTKLPNGKEGKWEKESCVCVLKSGQEIKKR